jgi:hypothetical protein
VSQFTGSTFGRYSRLWLIITGVFLLAMAGAFYFIGSGEPVISGGFTLTAGILGLVGAILVVFGLIAGRRAAATEQLLATGIAGQATITGLTQTGMYLNEQPQISMDLMVNLPGQAPYPAKHHEFVPLMLLGRLSSGAPLAVRVDPANPQRLAVDWQASAFSAAQPAAVQQAATLPPVAAGSAMAGSAAAQPSVGAVDESLDQVQAALAASGVQGVAAPFATSDQGSYTVEQLRAYLRANGVPTTATIDTLQDTGRIQGDERVYVAEMTLNITGQAPKKLPKSAFMVPITQSFKLHQGMSVPVRYAAENPDLLMVEWDKI